MEIALLTNEKVAKLRRQALGGKKSTKVAEDRQAAWALAILAIFV
jgi:hypothetical protein